MSVIGDLRTKISNLVGRSRIRVEFCAKTLKILEVMQFTMTELKVDCQLLNAYIDKAKTLHTNVCTNHQVIETILARVKDLPDTEGNPDLAKSTLVALMLLYNVVVARYTQVVMDGADVAKILAHSKATLDKIQSCIGPSEPLMPDRNILCDKCGRDLEHHYADYSCMTPEDAARVGSKA